MISKYHIRFMIMIINRFELTRSVYIYRYIYTHTYMGFPDGSAGKEFSCNVGDLGSIPGLDRSPGEGNGSRLQYSFLENSMDWLVIMESQSPWVHKELDMTEQLTLSTQFSKLICSIVLVSGTPLQYSCLDNPMDRGTW